MTIADSQGDLSALLRAKFLGNEATLALDNPALTAMCDVIAAAIVEHITAAEVLEGTYELEAGATFELGRIAVRSASGKATNPAASLPALGVMTSAAGGALSLSLVPVAWQGRVSPAPRYSVGHRKLRSGWAPR